MKLIDRKILCELNILKNRLDSGESIIQCLHTMGIPLAGHRDFLGQWERLCKLMLEGRVLPAKAVGEFVHRLEDTNRLLNLAQQKTLSARMQAYISVGIIFLLTLAAVFLFPGTLRPGFFTLLSSLSLSALSLFVMQRMLKNFAREMDFLEWLNFLRSLSLSLECGMTFPVALAENFPSSRGPLCWPRSLQNKLTHTYLEQGHAQNLVRTPSALSSLSSGAPLWQIADRVWETLCRNYQHGLPQVELITKLSRMQEEEFKNWMLTKSDKLSYLLLLPLFGLSVPAVLILLFAPLLLALT